MSDFYNRNFIIARKDHVCDCFISANKKDSNRYRRHLIHKGQRYARIAQVFDGNFTTSKLCLTHMALISALFHVDHDLLDEGIDYERAREYFKYMERNRNLVLTEMHKLHREYRKSFTDRG